MVYIYLYIHLTHWVWQSKKHACQKGFSWFVPSFTKSLSIVWPGRHLHNKLYNQHCLLSVSHGQTWIPSLCPSLFLAGQPCFFFWKKAPNPSGKNDGCQVGWSSRVVGTHRGLRNAYQKTHPQKVDRGGENHEWSGIPPDLKPMVL